MTFRSLVGAFLSPFSLAMSPQRPPARPRVAGRRLALGAVVIAATLAGCGSSDDPAPVCNGVERDGQCFAMCDEAIDCKGDTSFHCVAYPGHPEGKCFATCSAATDCAEGEACIDGTTFKGVTGKFCVTRTILQLPAGKTGDTCAAAKDCDGGHGLACLNGKCAVPPKVVGEGAACSAAATCDPTLSLECVKGICQPPPKAGPGEACSDTVLCDDTRGLLCTDGVCALPIVGPGEACSATVACDPAQNLACIAGVCGPKPPGPGEACSAQTPCDASQSLLCAAGVCQVPVASGGACSAAMPCDPSLFCAAGVCGPKPPALGEACSDATPCQPDAGLTCLEGTCHATCKSVTDDCATGFECIGLPAGDPSGAPGVCMPSKSGLAGPGQYGTFCPNATVCDGSKDFFCKGVAGDANAFCTQKNGCTVDTDCPSGFWCGSVTNPLDDKGNVDFDHPIKACLVREFCAPCETDLDCSAKTGGICVPDATGEKFCSLPCNIDKNSCQIGVSCLHLADGRDACQPDVGVCHVADAPKGCDPCRIDSDCGPGGLCSNGAVGNKPGMRWCSTPCGPPDAFGKNTCPLAPNGSEMVCLDENQLSLGGPFDATQPNSIYKRCYKPLTVDNTDAFDGTDPPNNTCGNSKREGDEECDDGNKFATDGCDKCKITDKCRFTLAEPNGDGQTNLVQNGMVIDKIPTFCKSFLVEGSIETAGDIDSLQFSLPDGSSAWAELFTDKAGVCSGDLVLEIRGGDVDLNVKCQDLDSTTKNLDSETPTLCADGNLGCGSCDTPGICGTCDDDSGIGDCPRALLTSTLQFQGYKVKYDSLVKTVRIYARDPNATVANYLFVVDRLTPGDQGPASPPGLGCY